MQADAAILALLQAPLMGLAAASDAGGRPSVGRVVGVEAVEGGRVFDICFSAWQWPALAADVRGHGRLAVTLVRPADYLCYQLKGRAALRAANAADYAAAARFIARAKTELARLGVAEAMSDLWLCDRDLVTARLRLEEAYEQTPGPRAGMAAVASAAGAAP